LPSYSRPPKPGYSTALIRQGIQGNVGVGVLIGRDGKAKCVWIAQSSGHAALDESAADALSRAEWLPLPDELEVVIPINFRINKGPPPPTWPKVYPRVRRSDEAPWAPCSKPTS
jgi:TonB family protein